MTNGENTAFVPIREYLLSRNFPGYIGYQIRFGGVHPYPALYLAQLGLGIEAYKHIITPLQDRRLGSPSQRRLSQAV